MKLQLEFGSFWEWAVPTRNLTRNEGNEVSGKWLVGGGHRKEGENLRQKGEHKGRVGKIKDMKIKWDGNSKRREARFEI